jgi:predicted MFS family arabinose efflux permease
MQIKSSDEMRGRMVSLSMMTFGIMPLSAVPFGAIAEHIGTPDSLMIAGSLLCVFIIFFYIFSPNFRKVSK